MATSGGSEAGSVPLADPPSRREGQARDEEMRRRRLGCWLLAAAVAGDIVGYLLVWGSGHLASSVQDVAVVAAMALVVIAWGGTIAAIWMLYRASKPWTVVAVLVFLAQLFVVLVAAALTRLYFDPNWLYFEY